MPAYVAAQDVPISYPASARSRRTSCGAATVSEFIDLRGTSLRITPENSPELSRLGVVAREQLREKIAIQHPAARHINDLNFMTFWHEPTIPGALHKNVHVFSAGQLDRSPAGTGPAQ